MKRIFSLLLLCLLASTGETLRCYKCSTEDGEQCLHDPSLNKGAVVKCDEGSNACIREESEKGGKREFRGDCDNTNKNGCTIENGTKTCVCRSNLCNRNECTDCKNINNSGSSNMVFSVTTIFLYALSIQILH